MLDGSAEKSFFSRRRNGTIITAVENARDPDGVAMVIDLEYLEVGIRCGTSF